MRAPKSARTPRANYYQVDGSDWLLGTETMSLAAQGAYMRLLLQQWRDRNVIRSPEAARHVAHAGEAEWTDIWEELREHFPADSDGMLRNRRCERERSRVRAISKKRSASGSKGGRPRSAEPNEKQTKSKCFPEAGQTRGEEEEEEEEETPTESSPSSPPSARGAPLDHAARIAAAWSEHPAVDTPAVRAAFEALEANREARKRRDPRCAGRRGPESVRAWLGLWAPRGPDALLAMLNEAVAGGWQDVREPDPRTAAPVPRAAPGQSGRDLIAAMAAALPDYGCDPLSAAREPEVVP